MRTKILSLDADIVDQGPVFNAKAVYGSPLPSVLCSPSPHYRDASSSSSSFVTEEVTFDSPLPRSKDVAETGGDEKHREKASP